MLRFGLAACLSELLLCIVSGGAGTLRSDSESLRELLLRGVNCSGASGRVIPDGLPGLRGVTTLPPMVLYVAILLDLNAFSIIGLSPVKSLSGCVNHAGAGTFK